MRPRFSPDYRFSDLLRAFLPARKNAVSLLEEEFARRSGHNAAVAFRYGRTGLYYLLKACGAQGREVVLPSYTCVVVPHAVVLAGAKPVFVDNAPGEFQPSQQAYLDAITPDTAMVIPTHVFGLSQETDGLSAEIRKTRPDIFILQDCAHGFFCADASGKVAAGQGDGALFGLNISKLANSVKGGMLTLKDAKLAQKVRQLAENGFKESGPKGLLPSRLYVLASALAFEPELYGLCYFIKEHTALLNGEVKYYDENRIDLPEDYAAPMSNFEAETGLASLRRLDERVRRRSDLAKAYCALLKDLPGIIFPEWKPDYTWSHFPVLLPKSRRDELSRALQRKCGAEIGKIIDYSAADMPCYSKFNPARCPNASDTASSVLNLPLTPCEGLFASLRSFAPERVVGALGGLLNPSNGGVCRKELLGVHSASKITKTG